MDETLPIPTNGQEAPDATEMQAIQAAYAEVSRRDTSLEQRLYHSHVRELVLTGLAVVLVLGAVALALALAYVKRHPTVVVQLVQVTDEGRALPQGLPQELLAYTPQEAAWKDMLGQWIRKFRTHWPRATLARQEWKWVYYHTCGDARALVARWEEAEKPFTPRESQTTVVMKAINKTPTPLAFHLLWEEITTHPVKPTVTKQWSGTFTVGRLQPPNKEALELNRLGLCVSAFDLSS